MVPNWNLVSLKYGEAGFDQIQWRVGDNCRKYPNAKRLKWQEYSICVESETVELM